MPRNRIALRGGLQWITTTIKHAKARRTSKTSSVSDPWEVEEAVKTSEAREVSGCIAPYRSKSFSSLY